MKPEEALHILVEKKNLTTSAMKEVVDHIMEGQVDQALTAGIMTALHMKGETAEEIVGCIEALRAHMTKVFLPNAIDIVGTGGDGSHTFNISTTSAFVVAGAGVPVAKHGNRAASSSCGSADVLEALDVNIMLSPKAAERVFAEVGMVFLFAPSYHPTLKHIVPIRRALKIRTMFNIVGPFANPSKTTRQLIGIPNKKLIPILTHVAKKLGYTRALIVHSTDGLDEVSTRAVTTVVRIERNKVTRMRIDPQALGFKRPSKNALVGGDAQKNAAITRAVLEGELGPRRDIVILNSAAALYVAGAVRSIAEGIQRAEHSIDSGSALRVLTSLQASSKTHASL
jgi:anthranilate phosphoribosyltransferase